jgi:uncharacterized protein YacL
MAWFMLARVLLVAAIVCAAVLLQPIHESPIVNAALGGLLSILIVLFEIQLRQTAVTSMLGALIGGVTGLAVAKAIAAALTLWTNSLSDGRVAFLDSVLLAGLPYLGLIIGARHGASPMSARPASSMACSSCRSSCSRNCSSSPIPPTR